MRKRTSEVAFYDCTLDEIIDLICRRHLLRCEPAIFFGFLFSTTGDLIAARMSVEGSVISDETVIVALPNQQPAIESTIRRMGMGTRVQRFELTGVRFWDDGDRSVFDQEFGPADQ